MKFWRTIKNHLLPWRGNAHRPHILRRQWLVALLGLALASEALILGHAVTTGGPDVFLAAVVAHDVFAYTEEARAAEGGQALQESSVLDAAAQAKADDMAAKGYFSHVGPDGTQPWAWFAKGGYQYVYAGENLAVRFDDSREVVDAWMASPAHRANIVKPQYREMGIGIAQGEYKGATATFVVQFFASPAATQAASPAEPVEISSSVPAPQEEVAGAEAGPATQSKVTPTPKAAEPNVAVVSEAPTAKEAEVPAPQPAAAAISTPAPAPQPSFAQSFMRAISNALSDSRTAGTWALGLVAVTLLTVLALTFFVRIQVQPTDLLLPGLAVALIAVTLIGANARFLPAATQSASVAGAGAGEIAGGDATERVSAFPDASAR